MPYATNIWVDFFDGNLNYLGSTDLMATGGPLNQLQSFGSIQFNGLDRAISNIQTNALMSYQ